MDTKLYLRTLFHNLISLFATLIAFSGLIFVIYASSNSRVTSKSSNPIGAIMLIIMPFILSYVITKANKKSTNNFINSQLLDHLSSNNIDIDYIKDSGSTSSNECYFPLLKDASFFEKVNVSYNATKSGNYPDLGFSYIIDEYKSIAQYKQGKYYKEIYSMSGQIYNFFYNIDFTNEPIIIASENFQKNTKYKGNKIFTPFFIQGLENMKITEKNGLKIAIKNDYDIDKIYALDFKKDIFKSEFYVVINNHQVSLYSPINKFDIAVPFFLTKGMLDRLLDDQKIKTFDFNRFLYDLAFVFKGLK